MKRRRWLWLFVGVAAIVLAVTVGYFVRRGFGVPEFPPMSLYWERDGRSSDLTADIKLMWATDPLTGNAGPNAGPNPKGSTGAAVDAASRVFNTADLIGQTREE